MLLKKQETMRPEEIRSHSTTSSSGDPHAPLVPPPVECLPGVGSRSSGVLRAVHSFVLIYYDSCSVRSEYCCPPELLHDWHSVLGWERIRAYQQIDHG